MCRGSRVKSSWVIGSTTSAITLTVGSAKNGSSLAVEASGTASMSDSWMPCHPRIEDPSKPTPSTNVPSSHVSIGNEQCCHVPSMSTNFRSTISAPAFFANAKNADAPPPPPPALFFFGMISPSLSRRAGHGAPRLSPFPPDFPRDFRRAREDRVQHRPRQLPRLRVLPPRVAAPAPPDRRSARPHDERRLGAVRERGARPRQPRRRGPRRPPEHRVPRDLAERHDDAEVPQQLDLSIHVLRARLELGGLRLVVR